MRIVTCRLLLHPKKWENGRVSRVMNQPASCTLASGAGKYLHGDAESEMICDMATKGF